MDSVQSTWSVYATMLCAGNLSHECVLFRKASNSFSLSLVMLLFEKAMWQIILLQRVVVKLPYHLREKGPVIVLEYTSIHNDGALPVWVSSSGSVHPPMLSIQKMCTFNVDVIIVHVGHLINNRNKLWMSSKWDCLLLDLRRLSFCQSLGLAEDSMVL